MEHQLGEQCHLFPASFWLAPYPEVDLVVNVKELEAEAGKDCHFCQFLAAWRMKGDIWELCSYKIRKLDWSIPLGGPRGLIYFGLSLEIRDPWPQFLDEGENLHKLIGWRRQNTSQKCGTLFSPVRLSTHVGEAATRSYPYQLRFDVTRSLIWLRDTEKESPGRSPSASYEAMEYSVALMKMWISRCEQKHGNACRATLAAQDFIPTRLLDLQAFQRGKPFAYTDDIKLVNLRLDALNYNDRQPPYLTLSHCWGPLEKRPATTTRASLVANKNRILFSSLPKTFQDAVQITRRLGQRYLWIDSLCIIQDDEADWAHEASLMAKVYTHSYCTLAALSSSDSSHGLNMVRPDFFLNHEIRGNQNDQYRVQAWKGTRHFGHQQLLWECMEGKACTQHPWPLFDRGQMTLRKAMASTSEITVDQSKEMRMKWQNLVEEYSGRSLAIPTDKLIALSGIAQSYQVVFPDAKYVAGLWSTHMPQCLLWASPDRSARRASEEYIAPSWSWASLNSSSSIKFLPELFFQPGNGFPEVEDMKGSPKHNDPYGALTDATLTLRNALLVQFDPEIKHLDDVSAFNGGPEEEDRNLGVLTMHDVAAGLAYLDDSDELLHGTGELVCLVIGIEDVSGDTRKTPLEHHFAGGWDFCLEGLLLRRVVQDDASTCTYRRVGIARYVPEHFKVGLEPERITLI
ncbi:heterokaryon incompatibility protein-domain-containing protein [Neurospora crassa]|nr:heterokaryon incompatibility protein-domain-containing protein [Neurospora crassa]